MGKTTAKKNGSQAKEAKRMQAVINTATKAAEENAKLLATYTSIDREVRSVKVATYVHLLAMLV
jgi:hypothetical protein